MYESKTYEAILREKLAKVSSALDKREGSIIYDALAPNSFESAMIYLALDTILTETFADTASRDYLIKRCAERGIAPLAATKAQGLGSFNIDVEIGARFSGDKFNWTVTEKVSDGKFYLTCDTPGAEPNGYMGKLIPVDYIDGLVSAELVAVVIYGEDEESTESLRSRYLKSFQSQSYSFNRQQYIATAEAIPGVGQCKPYRAWNGPGTVKLVITNSAFGVPSEELLNLVQTTIDPTQNSGEGLGLAPIDHEVTVAGVVGTTINVSTKITFAANWNITECLPHIEKALDDYYGELNSVWGDNTNLFVRISQIESKLLSCPGIIDISETKLNGHSENIRLGPDNIAVRGDFTNE